jgi:ABC-type branched-subunit amino acid transport system ATPase component
MLVLSIRGLSKTYPNGVRALSDVTLTIPTGMFGLLGPNGAGKSTLMRTIATLQEADSGSATIGPFNNGSTTGTIDVLRQKIGELGSQLLSSIPRGRKWVRALWCPADWRNDGQRPRQQRTGSPCLRSVALRRAG